MSEAPKLKTFSQNEIRETLNEIRHPFEIAVYSSDNYYNFGAIVRVAHNFLCKKIWMIDFAEFYKKASMGTHKWENISIVTLQEFMVANNNRNIISFERRGGLQTEDIRSFEYPEEPILFFGSEKFGVPQKILDVSNNIVSIPVFGVHTDYNLATASGIVMYDFVNKLTYR